MGWGFVALQGTYRIRSYLQRNYTVYLEKRHISFIDFNLYQHLHRGKASDNLAESNHSDQNSKEDAMTEEKIISRQDALKELKRFGISGNDVYLIDFIPLLEIVWADGEAQPSEVAILEEFVEKHVDNINKQAGCKVVELDQAKAFVNRFLAKRPDPEIMKTLRQFVKPLRLSLGDKKENQQLKESLLCACMDIAASAVTEYPYGLHDRFCQEEKKCFFNILESLSTSEAEEQPAAI